MLQNFKDVFFLEVLGAAGSATHTQTPCWETVKPATEITKDIKNQIQSKNNIGYINLKMGNNNIAISLFKEVIDLCRKHNSVTYLDLSYTNLSEAYEQLGMHEKALTSFKKYTNIKDSINGENVRKQILKIESEIKIASEKEKSIILNKKLQAEK